MIKPVKSSGIKKINSGGFIGYIAGMYKQSKIPPQQIAKILKLQPDLVMSAIVHDLIRTERKSPQAVAKVLGISGGKVTEIMRTQQIPSSYDRFTRERMTPEELLKRHMNWAAENMENIRPEKRGGLQIFKDSLFGLTKNIIRRRYKTRAR